MLQIPVLYVLWIREKSKLKGVLRTPFLNCVPERILEGISNPSNIIDAPATFTRELATAFAAQKSMIDILFSGSQTYKLADYIEQSIRKLVFDLHPEYKDSVLNPTHPMRSNNSYGP